MTHSRQKPERFGSNGMVYRNILTVCRMEVLYEHLAGH